MTASAAPAAATGLPGFNTPAVGFEQPFAMLEACHERVQRTLALLQRLREHVAAPGAGGSAGADVGAGAADEPARQAARDVLRYFDVAAPLHHQDEELHVFPRLLAQGPAEVVALVLSLQQDHVLMAGDWAAARRPLLALAEGRQARFSLADAAILDRFAGRYARHIAGEESIAYPAALALVPPQDLAAMGAEMASRRGARGPLRG